MLALVDGDIACYRAAAACQKQLDFGDGDGASTYVDPDEAAGAAVDTIRFWASSARCSKVLVCLTGKGNFRKAIYPPYKSNRSGVERPQALEYVRDVVSQVFDTASVDGLEADDLLGLALGSPRRGHAVCISMDKDLKTVPGLHYNPAKDAKPVMVLEAEANRTWLTQALTGDACDGYPGCRKIGPVKAAKLLSTWDGLDLAEGFGIVERAFCGAEGSTGLGGLSALIQARVARILRHGDYDKTTKDVLLWHPTTEPERLSLKGL